MKEILLVLVGGGIGSACRYGVSAAAGRAFGDGFAWGTLLVNLLGCLVIGFIVGLAALIRHKDFALPVLLSILVGLLVLFWTGAELLFPH